MTKPSKDKKVVILLPTYNEKGAVAEFIKHVFEQEKDSPGWKFELLIVDDIKSNRESKEFVKNLAKKDPRIHYLENNPSGLGVAVVQGHQYSIEHLHPDALAQIDADGQVEAAVIPRFLQALDEGYNLAIGSRFVKGGRNDLGLSRRIFSLGASFVVRLIMGPFNIKEATNSARAFTPELFKKINLERLPWKEPTFIIQPAFLNEAIIAGAKYKEVPLVFKDRAEGYSKMKIFNYTYDVITYSIDARLHKWGIKFDFFKFSRRFKLFIKFGTVGFIGTLVDFIFYKIIIASFGINPGIAKLCSAEIAVFNNFILNNAWTFKGRNRGTPIWQRFLTFNAVCGGGILMAGGIVGGLHALYGDGLISIFGRPVAYNNFYFFATIPPVMIWNFFANHFITWRHKEVVNVI